jgi:hypothetical protein
MFTPPHLRRALWAAAVALTAACFVAPSAHAGPLVAAAPSCEVRDVSRPFLQWADIANYVLVPNGTLESSRKWSLGGDAVTERGNEHYFVNDESDVSSLSLPADAAATTAPMCVGIEHPTLRFFARNTGSSTSTLLVEVQWEDATGRVRSTAIGLLTAGDRWRPSPPLPIIVNLLPLLPGEHTPVTFRFRVLGSGDWSVDDVYVDPWRHG